MGKKVLIIDDEINNIKVIADFFVKQDRSHKVMTSLNPRQGYQVAIEQQPDLIVMDWEMPEINGIELLGMLKKNETTKEIPVIIATGKMVSSDNLATALAAGAEDYIRKPLDLVELEARVRTVCRLNEQYKQMKELLKNEIDLKNRKLATATMYASQRNQSLIQVTDKLQNVIDGPESKDPRQELKALKKEINSFLDMDDSWENYKIHFEEVHPQFFDKIKAVEAKVTNNDLKLCAYLCMGLDNKEIAHLCNITHDGVKKSLYRLKKKLRLGEEENLRSFIQQLDTVEQAPVLG
ncbi:response regulator [Algivirga pacifica]|uniref:Response regulatory domain-containing protein n=1 Tax=Algivirga pacifica TaxID=1162670 RepID=A0ABP9D5A1_9BACT